MLTFTTDALRPQDRFEHWCEVRGKSLFGVTIELERDKRADFRGRFSATPVGSAVLAQMSASSYCVSRTASDIARVPSNSLHLAWQVRGPGHMNIGRDRVQFVRNGDLVFGHSNLPFASTPERTDGFDFFSLKIPATDELVLGARIEDAPPVALARDASLTRLVGAMFRSMARDLAQAGQFAGDVAHMVRLALLARGRLRPRQDEIRAALHAGYLHAAREILFRDLHRASLTPAAVAAELGISLRQLHALFEPTGLSFARTLTAARLKAARRALYAIRERSIDEIAFSCGFDSIATFYRVFRSTYGMTPGDARRIPPQDQPANSANRVATAR
ncbi:AraC-like DNA-binding protein [Bradyrhizobium japonicum]|uniref:AraC-like DNA-binding protein n=1 Tax=Bradyrhizobium elkanii TaxID=29448 RepID=A0ABV4FG12_BRAEL|nr:AraC family transcriptional regulator [Bradyrhizobium elkanii]MBP2430462.1 AraC-like DNA-binding protein [Bradyrhizobium elkanii]MCP1736198.1 AraC-like DNA-binding protein [Bradyrhizobium elkanii]MCP1753995.1 AraC-like DNA-binding protein [Bradyrhizobium elkanii]MCP1979515.1 AraC-like DNA-binding protein [Bradyrhizobium elkanii]MCS3571539.1 AraC-like DNA-binding protein [Bradyrhizobium elkanii]